MRIIVMMLVVQKQHPLSSTLFTINFRMKMEDGHKENNGQNVDLPPEMMHEIVSRLPVKPLCRFKLVSKSWQSLISDPDFVANYSKAAFENEDVFFRRRRLLFTFVDSGQRAMYSLDLDQFLNENTNVGVDGSVAAPIELDFVYNGFYSCYGLFLSRLCSGDWSYSLINPVTKESKKLQDVPLWRLPMEPYFRIGFGFDHSTNEYKVINGQQNDDGVVFSIYTLQTDSWRKIDCLFPYRVSGRYDGILVNGGVHWFARKVADESLVIISFSLAEEKVTEIALPPNKALTRPIQLGAFRDWLCITSLSKYSATFNEFWVMKNYGVSESWAKIRVSKPYKKLSHSGFWTKSHDLMVFDKSSFVMYNFNDDTYWTLSIGKTGEIKSVGIYVETLPTLTHPSKATSSKEDDNDIIDRAIQEWISVLSETSWDISSHSFRQKLKVE
ncbi:hypothetical protein ACLB2K_002885 [Fragaria x ananassa]